MTYRNRTSLINFPPEKVAGIGGGGIHHFTENFMHFLVGYFLGSFLPSLKGLFFTPRNAEVARAARAVNGLNRGHPKQVGQSHGWVPKKPWLGATPPKKKNMDTQNGHI